MFIFKPERARSRPPSYLWPGLRWRTMTHPSYPISYEYITMSCPYSKGREWGSPFERRSAEEFLENIFEITTGGDLVTHLHICYAQFGCLETCLLKFHFIDFLWPCLWRCPPTLLWVPLPRWKLFLLYPSPTSLFNSSDTLVPGQISRYDKYPPNLFSEALGKERAMKDVEYVQIQPMNCNY